MKNTTGTCDPSKSPLCVRFHALGSSGMTARRSPDGPQDGDRSELVELDPLIHERTRLAILTTLATSENATCSFIHLRDALNVTDGNLITHLRTLEQAGLLERRKTGAGRGSATTLRLTAGGHASFNAYLNQLETLVLAARGGVRS